MHTIPLQSQCITLKKPQLAEPLADDSITSNGHTMALVQVLHISPCSVPHCLVRIWCCDSVTDSQQQVRRTHTKLVCNRGYSALTETLGGTLQFLLHANDVCNVVSLY